MKRVSVVETRVIGNGQSNNGKNGNLQDKTAVTKVTTAETTKISDLGPATKFRPVRSNRFRLRD